MINLRSEKVAIVVHEISKVASLEIIEKDGADATLEAAYAIIDQSDLNDLEKERMRELVQTYVKQYQHPLITELEKRKHHASS